MIPLNAAEATDLLRSLRSHAKQARQQIERCEGVAALQRERLARIEAEIAAVRGLPMTPSPCPVCGETAPEPRWICLLKAAGEAKPGEPCPYSVEGDARIEAQIAEAARERFRADHDAGPKAT